MWILNILPNYLFQAQFEFSNYSDEEIKNNFMEVCSSEILHANISDINNLDLVSFTVCNSIYLFLIQWTIIIDALNKKNDSLNQKFIYCIKNDSLNQE